jgi:hypothetical protein
MGVVLDMGWFLRVQGAGGGSSRPVYPFIRWAGAGGLAPVCHRGYWPPRPLPMQSGQVSSLVG